ncbi:hypothetical protein ACO2J1_04255 [Leptospira interrogans]|uniref:Uncharacterized protein n=12 Tax=Leptospira interrogans TaxID=173 RepID=Q8EYY0_LEPIN|nr:MULTISPECIES: hypothetical protein [Leptospira]EMF72299.1 hypothetical protein LEP1GSC148_2691 [Leptospira interrogans serovar Canicola str. LT1962]EMG13537.1 hypothetical protein LEP1GSC151_0110 [Leptospira interrogans serovar Grippotyphosa str. LT2186]EMM82550.1 hypothetical protein LEP1GSC037_1851 [Leptospira interrogans str. 2006001854]EMN51378.1 hypothetical protein LEP1GSC088_4444 [Leptospira interrogans str. L1207]KAA1268881.1 hypothetical protein C5473_13530 [Leptospira interrogans 
MKPAEWFFVLSLLFAGLIYLFLLLVKRKEKDTSNSIVKYSLPKEDLNSSINRTSDSEDSRNSKMNVLEVFDYNGIKIMHENGIYTVNTGGEIEVYGSWQALPSRYQRMVKEMDHRATGEKKAGKYYMEILNGVYYVIFPDGKKHKYKRFEDIPEKIRKNLGY